MSKGKSENAEGPEKPEAFKGFVCPLRGHTKEAYCVQKLCQLWVPFMVAGPEGYQVMTAECAFQIIAANMNYITANLFQLRNNTAQIVDRLGRGPGPTAAVEEMTKEQLYEAAKEALTSLTVNPTPDGVQVTGWIDDESTRQKAFAWLKSHGFKFYREPIKMWFKDTRKTAKEG